MNKDIIYSFKLFLTMKKVKVMYAELSDGEYSKSYMKDGILEIEFIPRKEYLIALGYKNVLNL